MGTIATCSPNWRLIEVGDHESGQGYPGVRTLVLGPEASPIRWAESSHPGPPSLYLCSNSTAAEILQVNASRTTSLCQPHLPCPLQLSPFWKSGPAHPSYLHTQHHHKPAALSYPYLPSLLLHSLHPSPSFLNAFQESRSRLTNAVPREHAWVPNPVSLTWVRKGDPNFSPSSLPAPASLPLYGFYIFPSSTCVPTPNRTLVNTELSPIGSAGFLCKYRRVICQLCASVSPFVI